MNDEKPVPLPVKVGDGTRFEPYAVAMYGDLGWIVPLAAAVDHDDSIHGGKLYAGHDILWRNVPDSADGGAR